MQVKHYLSISLLLAALAACQTSPEVVVPQLSPQAGARAGASPFTTQRIANMRKYVLDELNYQRKLKPTLNLPTLTLNDKLNTAAQKHVNYMIAANTTSNTGSNSSTPYSRVTAEGYTPGQSAGTRLLEQFNGTYKADAAELIEPSKPSSKDYNIADGSHSAAMASYNEAIKKQQRTDKLIAQRKVYNSLYNQGLFPQVLSSKYYTEAGVGFDYNAKTNKYVFSVILTAPK